ncbi:MAG TPA: STAS domain-containing protein [Anaerolineae bacterium]
MSIWQEELSNDTWLVSVQGRLDQSQNPQLEEKLTDLLDDGHQRLIVDLTEATYINSGGLRCLVSAWRKARRQEGDLVLCGLNPRLQEIFSMVGFDKVFQIYSTCDLAEQAIQS